MASKDENATEKWKVISVEVKFKLNVNGVIEEITHPGEHWYCYNLRDSGYPEEVSEDKLININEENVFGSKDEDVPEEGTLARHFT